MSKYLCIDCGCTFSEEHQKELHIFYHKEHQIIKRKWYAVFVSNFLAYLLEENRKILRFIGVLILYLTIAHHFHWELYSSWWESSAVGLAIGLIM